MQLDLDRLPRTLKFTALAASPIHQGTVPPSVTVSEGTSNAVANFTMQEQQQSEWCWAANASSICQFYNDATTYTQCQIVNEQLNQTNCCTDGGSDACNVASELIDALQLVGNLNYHSPNSLSFDELAAEIDNGNPVCVRIAWNDGGAHFVTIWGYVYNNQIQYLQIADPLYTQVKGLDYDDFPSQYESGGSWTNSYTTQQQA